MFNQLQPSQDDSLVLKYRTLLDVSQSLASQYDLDGLFRHLSEQLRLVIDFEAVIITLYDPQTEQMRRYLLSSTISSFNDLTPDVSVEHSLAGLVWQTQKPYLLNRPEDAADYPPLKQALVNNEIRSACILPLTSLGHRLGTIGFGSRREGAYSETQFEFLQPLANQVAVAVGNVTNFETARAAQTELQHRLEQLRLMLNITTTVVSQLDLQELLKGISSSIREAIEIDVVTVSLFDYESHQLRTMAFDARHGSRHREIGFVLPLDGTPAGLAFTSGQAVFLDTIDLQRFPSEVFKQVYDEGYRSGGNIPLIAQGHKLGVLSFANKRENPYTDSDKELLCQVANQIAIAVENALNFEQARAAEAQAKRQFERERLMLEINNAVVSKLDLRELVQVVSSCLRETLRLDITSVSLYNEEANEFRAYLFDLPDILPPIEEGTPIPLEGTIGGVSLMSGRPIFVNRTDIKKAAADFDRRLIEAGIKSGGCVPLVAHERKLGILAVGSFREDAFTEADQELLVHVANQIAIAVENALNFERARQSEQQAIQQSEQLQLLLEINNAVVTDLDLKSLITTISSWLRTLSHYDSVGLALYDAESEQLRIYADPMTNAYLEDGIPIPLEGSAIGLAFTTGQPVWMDRLEDERFHSEFSKRFRQAGYKSGGCVPLIVHNRKLGILGIASYEEAHFTKSEMDLLCQVANQVAIAVENALNFKRAHKAERLAGEERDRANLLLDINNAVISQLDLKELVKMISASLLDILPHDTAGIALYDAERDQLREYANVAYKGYDPYPQGEIFPLTGTPAGFVFTSGQPLLYRRPDRQRFFADRIPRPGEQKPKSACLVPLISHGRKLGVLGVGSYQEDYFTEANLEQFMQIGGQVAIAVENALAYSEIESLKNKLVSEKLYLEEEIQSEYNFAEIIGQSTALKTILKQVQTVALTDAVVLIQGETGTGKELIARAIHNLSARRERTLVKLNCAAIPTGLLESELFGHEKGAFTGAVAQRVGRFELANKGTLFLDEVGDIPLELQPKLLRVLQESEFERLGSSRTLRVDVRLVAATNCDLALMVEEKKYRSDLYYRLNVFPVVIPPLRERREDIPLLVGYFIQKHARRMNKRIDSVSKKDLEALTDYHWPGNVRELENFTERAVILTQGRELEVPLSELKPPPEPLRQPSAAAPPGKLISLEDNERSHIEEVLRHTKGVIGGKGGAAEILGLPISTLRSRMKKLGLK